MGRLRVGLALLLIALFLAAVALTLREWASAGVTEVRDVPASHQEIAWLAPATSVDSWERLVAALELLRTDNRGADRSASASASGTSLRVNLDNAFPPLSADVPEVAVYFDDAPDAKLWVRWYKLSGENPSRRWLGKLVDRGRPPLAVIGGDTSDRALDQASALRGLRSQWPGPAPLYFITTATAERYYPREYQTGEIDHLTWPKLMEVYDQRTFRFCFTNKRMVEAVLDFVHQNPQVRLIEPHVAAAVLAQGDLFGGLEVLSALGYCQPYFLSTIFWADDGYSKDLGEIFLQAFADQAGPSGKPFSGSYNDYIAYSAGDFLEPNPREAQAVGLFLASNPHFRDQPQLLALPAAAQRARRFLRALCRRAPTEIRNAVVVTGDAINFNNIYRDRDLAWNIQDMPVPLVFFSHRNPIDTAAGFGQKDADGLVNATATQDLLLYRDVAETLLIAAFDRKAHSSRLVADAGELLERLGHTRWRKGRLFSDLDADHDPQAVPFFDAAGNRRPHTGEHIVWLRPVFDANRNSPEAFITVWRAGGEQSDRNWHTIAPSPLHVRYDQPNQEDSSVHGP
jgi:hypothetical protein